MRSPKAAGTNITRLDGNPVDFATGAAAMFVIDAAARIFLPSENAVLYVQAALVLAALIAARRLERRLVRLKSDGPAGCVKPEKPDLISPGDEQVNVSLSTGDPRAILRDMIDAGLVDDIAGRNLLVTLAAYRRGSITLE